MLVEIPLRLSRIDAAIFGGMLDGLIWVSETVAASPNVEVARRVRAQLAEACTRAGLRPPDPPQPQPLKMALTSRRLRNFG